MEGDGSAPEPSMTPCLAAWAEANKRGSCKWSPRPSAAGGGLQATKKKIGSGRGLLCCHPAPPERPHLWRTPSGWQVSPRLQGGNSLPPPLLCARYLEAGRNEGGPGRHSVGGCPGLGPLGMRWGPASAHCKPYSKGGSIVWGPGTVLPASVCLYGLSAWLCAGAVAASPTERACALPHTPSSGPQFPHCKVGSCSLPACAIYQALGRPRGG